MINHIRYMLKLFVQKRWLVIIHRQLNAVNRADKKVHQAKQNADGERFVLNRLIDEYNIRYPDGFRMKEKNHAEECAADAVDAVEVRHGRWIEHMRVDEFGDCLYIDHECSKCHVTEHFQDDDVRAFCPNCGAKMDGGVG